MRRLVLHVPEPAVAGRDCHYEVFFESCGDDQQDSDRAAAVLLPHLAPGLAAASAQTPDGQPVPAPRPGARYDGDSHFRRLGPVFDPGEEEEEKEPPEDGQG